ncbi:MAG: GHMP kinase, partial [Planctomycetota bacterium]
QGRFRSLRELTRDVELHGYYGGVRLVKATIRRFVDYCDAQGLELHKRTFSIRYESNIPRQVGLAGSSAIIIATLRALMEFYNVDIPRQVQPSLALSVETDELGISAGLQDRVIQVYEGLVYMDFARDRMKDHHGFQCGEYEPLDPDLLPPLYLAFSTSVGEPTEVTHGPLSERYRQGDLEVHAAMDRFAELTVRARAVLENGEPEKLGELLDQNFDERRRIMDLSPGHLRMVEAARAAGASAKFSGSGGAIIGSYTDDAMFTALKQTLERIGCDVFRLN